MSEHAEMNMFCIPVALITTFGSRTLKITFLFNVYLSTSADVDLLLLLLLLLLLFISSIDVRIQRDMSNNQ
jgi:hypothetical protein